MKALFLVLVAVPFLIQCDDSDSNSSGNCSYALSGVVSGEFGSSPLSEPSSGLMWFNCSEGPLNDGPEVSVGIEEVGLS